MYLSTPQSIDIYVIFSVIDIFKIKEIFTLAKAVLILKHECMIGIAEIGASALQMSERRLAAISQNIANIQTSGYQSIETFQVAIGEGNISVSNIFQNPGPEGNLVDSYRNPNTGELKATGDNFSFALSGKGYFALRNPNGPEDIFDISRNGSFGLSSAGFVVDARGWRVQNVDGQDIRLLSDDITVESDGTIFEQGRPVDKFGVFVEPTQRVDFSTLPETAEPSDFVLRQGMSETANVSLPDQMVEMMQVIRQAETGSRIIQAYDTLLGQAISTFGQGR